MVVAINTTCPVLVTDQGSTTYRNQHRDMWRVVARINGSYCLGTCMRVRVLNLTSHEELNTTDKLLPATQGLPLQSRLHTFQAITKKHHMRATLDHGMHSWATYTQHT